MSMDRMGSFLAGLLTGAVVVLALQKLMDSREISLESLEDSIEERLDRLEGSYAEAALN